MFHQEVVGVGYSSEPYAITVGCFGNIVKWDLNANIAKNYNFFLKNFKPTCMACSHHISLNVAVGTKQGVVFVLDLKSKYFVYYISTHIISHLHNYVKILYICRYDILLYLPTYYINYWISLMLFYTYIHTASS